MATASTALVRRTTLADLTGRQKAAILLMQVGGDAQAAIMEGIAPDEVEAISFEIAKMDRIDPELVEVVIEEWQHTEEAAFSLASGGVDVAYRVLVKAFGEQRAGQVLKRIEAQLHDHISLTHLRSADTQQLKSMIRNEYPQTTALILAFLDPDQTAGILRSLDVEDGSDLMYRVARMENVQPDVLRIIEDSLTTDADLAVSGDGSRAGGPAAVAEVLNLLSATIEKELLDGVTERDADLSDQIKDLMFVFEDILKLDAKGITRLLRDVDSRELSVALKLASEELKDMVFDSMSSRARDALTEEMEFLGPVRVSDVELAQAAIVRIARLLEEAGEIVIGGGDDDVLVE